MFLCIGCVTKNCCETYLWEGYIKMHKRKRTGRASEQGWRVRFEEGAVVSGARRREREMRGLAALVRGLSRAVDDARGRQNLATVSPPRVSADSELPASPSGRLRREKAPAPKAGTPLISWREIRGTCVRTPGKLGTPGDMCLFAERGRELSPHRVRSPQ